MNTQLAAEEFREIIRMNPKGAGGHFGLGVALSEGGKRREAEAAYRRAISLNPVFAGVLYLQAVVLCLQERKEAAGQDFRRPTTGIEDQGLFQKLPFPRRRASMGMRVQQHKAGNSRL